MTPIKLKAPLKDYLWGGTRLKTDFGKETSLQKVAESWELSCHKDGPSVVASGEDQGLTLPEYIEKHGKRILGTHGSKFQDFPILIKLIDAKDNLSIQVHPDNEFALRVEGEYGKTEMWYIVDCEPGAYLYYGFQKEISKEEFERRIQDNTLTDVLKTGANDVYEITGDDGKAYLLPAIPMTVIEIRLEEGLMRIRPIEGIFDHED